MHAPSNVHNVLDCKSYQQLIRVFIVVINIAIFSIALLSLDWLGSVCSCSLDCTEYIFVEMFLCIYRAGTSAHHNVSTCWQLSNSEIVKSPITCNKYTRCVVTCSMCTSLDSITIKVQKLNDYHSPKEIEFKVWLE